MVGIRSQFPKYVLIFVSGIAFSHLISGIGAAMSFLFLGSEIHSQASFPLIHLAELCSRPGLGDQTLTFMVDGKSVYVSGDAPGGDLKERIFWDSTGSIVTLELSGKKVFVYNARLKQEVKE